MISELLYCALTAISSNRTQESWVAGSSVLAQFIDRVPNDIDIHHISSGAFAEAVEKDIKSLIEVGFSTVAHRQMETEFEVTFTRSGGTIAMNWVLEPKRPLAVVDDPLLGARASFADVITRKIEMYMKDRQSKHRNDLVSLFCQSAKLASELNLTKAYRRPS